MKLAVLVIAGFLAVPSNAAPYPDPDPDPQFGAIKNPLGPGADLARNGPGTMKKLASKTPAASLGAPAAGLLKAAKGKIGIPANPIPGAGPPPSPGGFGDSSFEGPNAFLFFINLIKGNKEFGNICNSIFAGDWSNNFYETFENFQFQEFSNKVLHQILSTASEMLGEISKDKVETSSELRAVKQSMKVHGAGGFCSSQPQVATFLNKLRLKLQKRWFPNEDFGNEIESAGGSPGASAGSSDAFFSLISLIPGFEDDNPGAPGPGGKPGAGSGPEAWNGGSSGQGGNVISDSLGGLFNLANLFSKLRKGSPKSSNSGKPGSVVDQDQPLGDEGKPGPVGGKGKPGKAGKPGSVVNKDQPLGDEGKSGPVGGKGKPGKAGKPGSVVNKDQPLGDEGKPGRVGGKNKPGKAGRPGSVVNKDQPLGDEGKPGPVAGKGKPGEAGKPGSVVGKGKPGYSGKPGSEGGNGKPGGNGEKPGSGIENSTPEDTEKPESEEEKGQPGGNVYKPGSGVRKGKPGYAGKPGSKVGKGKSESTGKSGSKVGKDKPGKPKKPNADKYGKPGTGYHKKSTPTYLGYSDTSDEYTNGDSEEPGQYDIGSGSTTPGAGGPGGEERKDAEDDDQPDFESSYADEPYNQDQYTDAYVSSAAKAATTTYNSGNSEYGDNAGRPADNISAGQGFDKNSASPAYNQNPEQQVYSEAPDYPDYPRNLHSSANAGAGSTATRSSTRTRFGRPGSQKYGTSSVAQAIARTQLDLAARNGYQGSGTTGNAGNFQDTGYNPGSIYGASDASGESGGTLGNFQNARPSLNSEYSQGDASDGSDGTAGNFQNGGYNPSSAFSIGDASAASGGTTRTFQNTRYNRDSVYSEANSSSGSSGIGENYGYNTVTGRSRGRSGAGAVSGDNSESLTGSYRSGRYPSFGGDRSGGRRWTNAAPSSDNYGTAGKNLGYFK